MNSFSWIHGGLLAVILIKATSTYMIPLLFLCGEVECFSRTIIGGQASHLSLFAASRIRKHHHSNFLVESESHDGMFRNRKHGTSCKATSFFGVGDDDAKEDEDEDENENKNAVPLSQESKQADTQLQIEQQQKQIDMLMEMVKNSNSNHLQMQQQQVQPQNSPQNQPLQTQPIQLTESSLGEKQQQQASNSDMLLPPPLPGMFDERGEEELLDHVNDPARTTETIDSSNGANSFNSNGNIQQQQGGMVPVAPLKAMLFIDGTWLYYSLYRRKEEMDPIVKKFGKGWPFRYRFDWNEMPRIVCEQLVSQQKELGWSSTGLDTNPLQNSAQRPVEIVRASVFTSYKKTTDPKSFRARMYNEMADANYDIHMLESTSNGPEKCVDISLAVEMLHYATVPNAYDVAILLSGDKDFIPAMVRTRQKGRKVGVVSMKTGCNRALYEGSHIKDFDVVWLDNFLDRLLVPLPPDQVEKHVQSVHDRGMVSCFTLTKVILDFVSQSPYGKVSSRDVGRRLKNLELKGGTSLLDDIKVGQGGLRRFLQDRMPEVFVVTDRTSFILDPNDKSYWVTKKDGAANVLLEEAKRSKFSDQEKEFLQRYQSGATERGTEEDLYFYTMEVLESTGPNINVNPSNGPNNSFNPAVPVIADVARAQTVEQKDYSSWTVLRLKELCRQMKLPVSGAKHVLIERIQKTEKTQTPQTDGLVVSEKDMLENHLVELVKYYIRECRGYASSRDLGRFLASNQASSSGSTTALQELKNTFGGVAAFLNQRHQIFTTVREPSDGDPNNFSFGITLKEISGGGSNQDDSRVSPPPPHSTALAPTYSKSNSKPISSRNNKQSNNVDPKIDAHIEALLREYLHASGGEASSRNIGRYLAANSAVQLDPTQSTRWGNRDNTALKQLKNSYGSIASYITAKEDTFLKIMSNFQSGQGEMDLPSSHDFGVRLR